MSEQEQKKYRVKVEVIDGSGEKLDNEYIQGIECNAFVLLAISEDGCETALHGVTTMDIAKAISKSGELMAASVIAKALREALRYESNDKLAHLFASLGRD